MGYEQADQPVAGSAGTDIPVLRSTMPDIAMASASIARLSIVPQQQHPLPDSDVELLDQVPPVPDLDLGDGASHIVPGSASGAASATGTYTHRWS
jgi:hypothetical protein